MIRKRLYILALSGSFMAALAGSSLFPASVRAEVTTKTVTKEYENSDYDLLDNEDYRDDADNDTPEVIEVDGLSVSGSFTKCQDISDDDLLSEKTDDEEADENELSTDQSIDSLVMTASDAYRFFSKSNDISKSSATSIAKSNAKKNYKIKTSTVLSLSASKSKYKGKNVWEVAFEAKTQKSSHYYSFEYQILRSSGKILHREKEW